MPIPTATYVEQNERWPRAGRHILAHYDDQTVIVYQAYCPEIGHFAAKRGYFGGDFSYSRMSWIKPNFLWMMYRSSWGSAQGQEVVLAVRLRRAFFDSLLRDAVASSFGASGLDDRDEWKRAVASSDVRLQWDPDHYPSGGKCERRAIQLGLRGERLAAYGKDEVEEIIDVSHFVAKQSRCIGDKAALMTPVERVYVPEDLTVAERLGLGR